MGDREITLNYIIPDVPVVFFSLSPDLQTPNNLTTYFNGYLGYDENKKIKNFPFINTIDDNAMFIFPVTSDILIMGIKNRKTSDTIISNISRWIDKLDSHNMFRAFTNLAVLGAAREYVYSKSQDDIKEINKYIRGFENPFMYEPYDPYIQSFRDHKPKI